MIPNKSDWYQHRYGGIYQVDGIAKYSDREDDLGVVYRHVFPFEKQMYVRPLSEWTETRFRLITTAEAHQLMERDREEFKALITHNKKIGAI
jgi:hypothetical protein